MRRRFILAINLGLAMMAVSALAHSQPQRSLDSKLTIKPLSGGAFWVEGGVSNAGFIIGDKGVIAIDAQYSTITAKNELAEIAKITSKPVNVIIITHSDPDHINGLPAFPPGTEIIAQENAKTEMVEALADPHPTFTQPPPELKDYLPTHTVNKREDTVLDGVHLVLIHTAPAHTSGDLIVYMPAQKIVFAGDLLTPAVGLYPGIHLAKHGSSLGWIESVKAMLALDADVFVSGHGDPLSRSEVAGRIQATEARRAQIKALVDEHKSLDEVKQALHDSPPTGALARFPTFTETTYQELTSH